MMKSKTLTAAFKDTQKRDMSKCFSYDAEYLKGILHIIDEHTIVNFNKEQLYNKYGFGKKECELTKKLLSLKEPIHSYYKSILGNYDPPLNESQLNNIISLILNLTETNYTPVHNQLEIEYPEEFSSNCVPYDTWERALYVKAPNLKINVSPIKECSGFTYDLVVKKDKEKACKFLYNLSAKVEDICNYDFKVDVKKETCALEYDMIINKQPNCDFTYSQYVEFREDGFTKELIEELSDLGITTTKDPDSGDYIFTTEEGNTYTASSLTSIEQIINNI